MAVEKDHLDVVTKLLGGEANPNVKDEVSTVYPRRWCSLTLFIEILFLLGVEYFGKSFVSSCLVVQLTLVLRCPP